MSTSFTTSLNGSISSPSITPEQGQGDRSALDHSVTQFAEQALTSFPSTLASNLARHSFSWATPPLTSPNSYENSKDEIIDANPPQTAQSDSSQTSSLSSCVPSQTSNLASQIGLKLLTGYDIQAQGNSYIDPISKKIFTIDYAGQVKRDQWQICTQELVGAVTQTIDIFIKDNPQVLSSLNELHSYTFNWAKGSITIELKSGANFTLTTGSSLQDAIKPYLKDTQYLDKAPDPRQMYDSLQSIEAKLGGHHKAFIYSLMQDTTMQSKLERAIEHLEKDKRSPKQLKGYKLLLDLARGLGGNAKVSLGEDKSRQLTEFLDSQPHGANRLKNWISPYGADEAGDQWMRMVRKYFEIRLQDILTQADPTSAEKYDESTIKLNAIDCGECAQEFEKHLQQMGIRPAAPGKPGSYHSVEIIAPSAYATADIAINPNRMALHIEPYMKVSEDVWVQVQDVTCQKAQKGVMSQDSEYITYVKRDDTWWQIDQEKIEQVSWSQVQRAAAFQATRIGVKVEPAALVALASDDAASDGSQQKTQVFTQTHANTTKQIVSMPEAHQQALNALRDNQCKTALAQLLEKDTFAPFREALIAKLVPKENHFIGSELNENGKQVVRQFFSDLKGLSGNAYALAHTLSYNEIKLMAEVYGGTITVLWADDQAGQISIEPSKSLNNPPIQFSASYMDINDPEAKVKLYPSVEKSELP